MLEFVSIAVGRLLLFQRIKTLLVSSRYDPLRVLQSNKFTRSACCATRNASAHLCVPPEQSTATGGGIASCNATMWREHQSIDWVWIRTHAVDCVQDEQTDAMRVTLDMPAVRSPSSCSSLRSATTSHPHLLPRSAFRRSPSHYTAGVSGPS